MPALLRGFEALASLEPLHRNRICRVGKAMARGARDGGFAAFLVGLPRDCLEPRNRLALGLVRRVVEAHVESFVELGARQRRRCLSLADLGHGWRASECKRIRELIRPDEPCFDSLARSQSSDNRAK